MKNLHLFSPRVKHTESYFAWAPVLITELAWSASAHTDAQSLKLSYSITKAKRVLVKGSLMPLVVGNWSVFGDSLAKTSIILSSVHFSWLFWSCLISMWIHRLFFTSICLQFRAARGRGRPRHEFMNKHFMWQWSSMNSQPSGVWFNSGRRC